MTDDRRNNPDNETQEGEVVLTTLPDQSDAVDIPEDAPHNETPTGRAAKFHQLRDRGIIPDNEDG